jgi:glycosyltransferase involved in cell wall biosynthesis
MGAQAAEVVRAAGLTGAGRPKEDAASHAGQGIAMRFALIGPTGPFRGGIAHHTTLLYRSLAARDPGLLVSFRRQYPKLLFPGSSDRDPSEQPLAAPCERLVDPLAPWSWWRAARRVAAFEPRVVVVAWWVTFLAPALGSIARLVRRSSRAPVVFLCHNVLPHEPRPWDPALARFALTAGSSHIVPSAAEESALRRLVPGARPVVHPHPIYDMFAAEMVSRSEARRRLGLPAEGPLLLLFGLVRPYKGLGTLLEALPAVRAALPDVHLLVAGEIWGDSAAYREQIDRLKIGAAVTLIDRYIPNELVPICFSAADLVVLPYLRSTQSGVAQLAFGSRRPVIATSTGGMADLVRDGRNGLLVPPGDSPALARAIVRFFLEDLGTVFEPGVERTRSEHSWQRLVDVIEAVAGGAGGAAP